VSEIGDLCRTFPDKARAILRDQCVELGWNFSQVAKHFRIAHQTLLVLLRGLGLYEEFMQAAERYRRRFEDPCE
jgi:hypothetical protein